MVIRQLASVVDGNARGALMEEIRNSTAFVLGNSLQWHPTRPMFVRKRPF